MNPHVEAWVPTRLASGTIFHLSHSCYRSFRLWDGYIQDCLLALSLLAWPRSALCPLVCTFIATVIKKINIFCSGSHSISCITLSVYHVNNNNLCGHTLTLHVCVSVHVELRLFVIFHNDSPEVLEQEWDLNLPKPKQWEDGCSRVGELALASFVKGCFSFF